jgi:hypothetical protein
MAPIYRSNRTAFARPANNTAAATPRPAAVDFPEALAAVLGLDAVEICDFGVGGCHLTVQHGQLMGVPFQGDLGKNGLDTPRFTFASVDKFLRAQGFLYVAAQDKSNTSRYGEAYTVKTYVKAA